MKWMCILIILLLLPTVSAHEDTPAEITLWKLIEETNEHFPPPQSLPGDFLYPVYRFFEDVQMAFTFDRGEKALLNTQFTVRRFSEGLALFNTTQDPGVFMPYLEGVNRTVRDVQLNAEIHDVIISDSIEKELRLTAIKLQLLGIQTNVLAGVQERILQELTHVQEVRKRAPVLLEDVKAQVYQIIAQAQQRQIDELQSQLEHQIKVYKTILAENGTAVVEEQTKRLKKSVEFIGEYIDPETPTPVKTAYKTIISLWHALDRANITKGKTRCAQIITRAEDPEHGECKQFPTPCHVPQGWVTVKTCLKTPCIQVITPAVDPATGNCIEYPTPCDVPHQWVTVDRCESPS